MGNILEINERAQDATYGSTPVDELSIGDRIIFRRWNDELSFVVDEDIELKYNIVSNVERPWIYLKVDGTPVYAHVDPDTRICTYTFKNKPRNLENLFLYNSSTNKASQIIKFPDISLVKSFYKVFYNAYDVDFGFLKNLDFSHVTDMKEMFYSTSVKLDDLAGFNTDSCINMNGMFNGVWDHRSNVEDVYVDVSLPSFDTSNVESMRNMFYGCNLISSFDLSNFNTSNVEDMYAMFSGCSGITSLDLSNFDTSKVENYEFMFASCKNLSELNLSNWTIGKFGVTIGTSPYDNHITHYMFSNCNALTTVTGPVTLVWGYLDLSDCPLDHDSAMVFINGTQNVKDVELFPESNACIRFKSTTYNLLTTEERKIATSRGWKITYR